MSEKKYWHELSQEEIDKIISDSVTNRFVVENYKQPDWCTYPEALMGVMGCWSLTDNSTDGLRTKISHDYCTGCPCYKK